MQLYTRLSTDRAALTSTPQALVRPNARLVPVVYYPMIQAAAALPLDGMLFYFRNEKQGRCPATCDPRLLRNCTGAWPADGCLAGVCAEVTAANVAGEVADARAALAPDLPLHVGVYVTGRAPSGYNCSAPSPE